MDSYIVHIYRRDQDDQELIAGIVELVENQQRISFRSLTQLNEIIAKLKTSGSVPGPEETASEGGAP